jgi:hypothetical protein
MTAKQQKLSWKFELDLDGELKKREKMLAEKEQWDAKKKEKAARKAINDANRTNNRRKKRQAERWPTKNRAMPTPPWTELFPLDNLQIYGGTVHSASTPAMPSIVLRRPQFI